MDTAATVAGGGPSSPWMPLTGTLGWGEGRAAAPSPPHLPGYSEGNLVPAAGGGSSNEKIVACP